MEFKLTVLGTASAMPVTSRNQSAQVLSVHGRFFLIDCGEGVQRQLIANHIPLQKIEGIFISHIHGDHLFGLYALLSTMGMTMRQAPLNIYAPVGFGPILKFFMSYYGEGISFDINHIPLKMKSPEIVFESKTIEISAFPLNHGIDTFGFKFAEKMPMHNVRKPMIENYGLSLAEIGTLKRGEDVVREYEDGTSMVIPNSEAAYLPYDPRSYAYCSDTAPFPEEADWVKGVDILYHEATYIKEYAQQAVARHHSTTVDAASVALKAGAKKLVIAHYSSRCKNIALYQQECREVFPESYAANDGDVFEIPMTKYE